MTRPLGRRRRTKSERDRTVVRAKTRRRADDPVLKLSGDIDGLPPDLSEKFDCYLSETFGARARASYRGTRRSRSR